MANDLVLPEQQMPSSHDTRFLLSMMVEFCHQFNNVLYPIIHVYDCMNLNPVKYNLKSMGHCLPYNNSCVLHPICCSGGNSVAFVKFFKNHTVFLLLSRFYH